MQGRCKDQKNKLKSMESQQMNQMPPETQTIDKCQLLPCHELRNEHEHETDESGEQETLIHSMTIFSSMIVVYGLLNMCTLVFDRMSIFSIADIFLCLVLQRELERKCDEAEDNVEREGAYSLGTSLQQQQQLVESKKFHLGVFIGYLVARLFVFWDWSQSLGDVKMLFHFKGATRETLRLGMWSVTHEWVHYLFVVSRMYIFINGCILLYTSYRVWHALNGKAKNIRELDNCCHNTESFKTADRV